MRIVDAHFHLWDPGSVDYALLNGSGRLAPLMRPILGAEFDAVAASNGVSTAIAVEAASAGADPVVETVWLLTETARSRTCGGVVAYAAVEHPEIAAYLDQLVAHPTIVGVRRSFESVADGFILSAPVVAGIREVSSRGLPFDLVLFGGRLAEAVELVRLLPETQFVLDHLGKPPIDGSPSSEWRDQIAALAQLPNVVAKVSGLVTEASIDWSPDLLRPYFEHAVDCFGCPRLMFGSDWPICELAGGYARWLDFTKTSLERLPRADRVAFSSGTAERIYKRP